MEEKLKAIDLIENPKRIFVAFKPINSRQDKFSVNIYCTGYNDMFCTISELLRVSIAALEYNDEGGSVAKLLEIIYDLIPMEEGNLLDMLHRQYLEKKANFSAEEP